MWCTCTIGYTIMIKREITKILHPKYLSLCCSYLYRSMHKHNILRIYATHSNSMRTHHTYMCVRAQWSSRQRVVVSCYSVRNIVCVLSVMWCEYARESMLYSRVCAQTFRIPEVLAFSSTCPLLQLFLSCCWRIVLYL